jgi:hypothetical protein
MRTTKIVQAAKAAKADGYKYFTSVVKSHFATTYHHVVKIDDVLNAGKWIPAPYGQLESGAHCRIGVSKLPDKSINKSDAIVEYCNNESEPSEFEEIDCFCGKTFTKMDLGDVQCPHCGQIWGI